MGWALYVDDNFGNTPAIGSRADTYPTSVGAAGSTTGVGNGWTDAAGGIWYIDSSNVLNGLDTASSVTTSSYTTARLDRPTTEKYLAQRIVTTHPAGYSVPHTSGAFNGVILRNQGGGTFYLAHWDSQYAYLYKLSGGTVTQLIQTAAYTLTAGHQYQFEVDAPAPASGTTSLTITLKDLTAATTVITQSANDSTAALQNAGYAGLTTWDAATPTQYPQYTRVQLYQGDTASPTLTVSPTSASATDGGAAVSITATLSNSTAGLTASVAKQGGGTAAGTISTTTPTSGTAFTYTPPASGSGTDVVTVTDATDSLTATCTITYGGPALAIGTPSFAANDPTDGIKITASITGGTSPYSSQLYRSASSGFTPPGSGTAVGSAVSGASPTLQDATPPTGPLFYKVHTTDSASGAVTSTQLAASALASPLTIGFVGDSIFDPSYVSTLGNSYSVPQAVVRRLAQINGNRNINAGIAESTWNQGHAGYDTGAWVAGTSTMNTALSAFAGYEWAVVMLGANDCRNPADTYTAGHRPVGSVGDGTTPGANGSYMVNLNSIVGALTGAGMKVFIVPPNYILPGSAFNSVVWDDASINLLWSYGTALQSLVNWTTVFSVPVDHGPYAYFMNKCPAEYYQENGTSAVHPNQAGVDSYGEILAYWFARAASIVGVPIFQAEA